MPRFAANLSMMFPEAAFLDRFALAADAGFAAVEFAFPYQWPASAIAGRLAASRLALALFNLPPGDEALGERGLATLPGREDAFRESVELALAYAAELDCRTLHVMAGLLPDETERTRRERLYVENLRHAAGECAAAGITLLIEPINNRDVPNYYLNYQDQARRIIDKVGAHNLKLQLDLYHCQIMEGDLARHIRDLLPITGHLQIAGVPDRHEPDRGEVNYRFLFDLLDELGYPGWVGCEYRPRGPTEAGLGWFQPYRRQGSTGSERP